eukprot:jgi/Chrzof1/3366/Cz12g22150.t1
MSMGARTAGAATVVYTRSDIQGNDINCNQVDYTNIRLSYCKMCEGIANIEAACLANKNCKAFTYDGYCGYLKSGGANKKVYREGYAVYVPKCTCNSC